MTSSHRLTVGFAVAAAAGLLSCRAREPWTPVASPVASGGQQLAVKGTLRYTGIEGGFYQLFADNGPDYDPLNLPPQFQREGLRVEVVAQLRPDVSSWHAAGPLVTILRLRPLTPQ